MRLLLAAAVAVAVAFSVFVGTAAAATTNVSIVSCADSHGGQMTVPPGNSVTFTLGWLSRSAGLTRQFLQAETTTASLDGNPIAAADSYWSAPTATSGGNLTTWSYTTGPLASGQSETLTYDVVLSHKVSDGFGNRVVGSIFGGPVSCTVTAS